MIAASPLLPAGRSARTTADAKIESSQPIHSGAFTNRDQAVLGLASTAWSRFVKAPEWIGWLLSILASAVVLALLPAGSNGLAAIIQGRHDGSSGALVPLFLTLVLPQLLAFPLTRTRPNWRPAVAVGVVIAALALWS